MQSELHKDGSVSVVDGIDRICCRGEMADRTRRFDWSGTPLGPLAGWPEALVVLVNMMLANQQPMLLFWGADLIQLYNDAAIPVYGPDKHPNALGQPARQGWSEVWHLVGGQIEDALLGHPAWKQDTLVPVYRNGRLEDAWFTYSYSSVYDGAGAICGVLVTCIETTGRVQAARSEQIERERLEAMFQQAPVFFAVLRGPQHIFELANPQYMSLIGNRDVVGKPVAEALPEVVDQGYVAILDRVYQTGEPFIGNDLEVKLTSVGEHPDEIRVLDFVYQPFREADGSISGVLVLGVDMTSRRRATQALLSAQKNRASVIESMSEGFVLVDGDGRFRSFNRAASEVYRLQGLDCNELIGNHLLEVFPDLEESAVGAALLRCLRHHEPTVAQGLFKLWNRSFLVRNYPTPDGGVANLFQDITERVHAENQLLEHRERFEFATNAAQIGYWFCDLPFAGMNWDKTVKEHFWLPPDAEVDIERFYQLLHPDDREPTRHAIDTSIRDHTNYDVEYRTVSPDGRIKWIHAIGRTAYAEDGTPLRFDGVTQDVTALRQIRQALDEERARLSAVFENVPIGILFTLADGRVVNANRQAERILGRPVGPGAVENYQELTVLHPDGRRVEPGDRPLTLALNHGGIHRGEYEYVRPDGTKIWVEMIGAPILDAQGRIVGAVDAIADIDVRKRAESALVRSEKLALVGRLAASISHEINNPLEAVTNLLYIIEHNSPDNDTRLFSRMAQEELARVSHIVTHTLRFNRQTVAPREQKISDLVESSVAIYEGRLRNSSITLDRSYADSLPVYCSGSELRQVFANIIGNSFDATKNGGHLALRARDQHNWRTGQPGVRVTIADSGHGMSEQVRQRLFEPFFTTKGDNGTGLGLWVTREILTKHRARIRVKSREGERSGTVFSIWFPHDAAATPSTRPD